VIGVQATLGKEFLHVTVGKREAQVPADRKEDHLRFKLAPLEQFANRRGQGRASGQPITQYLQSCNTS